MAFVGTDLLKGPVGSGNPLYSCSSSSVPVAKHLKYLNINNVMTTCVRVQLSHKIFKVKIGWENLANF